MKGTLHPNLSKLIAEDPTLLERADGRQLAAWRKSMRISQAALARWLGLARSTVARYELMSGAAPRTYILALAAVERLVRHEHAMKRDLLRHRVAQRRRRKRERERLEAEQVGHGFW